MKYQIGDFVMVTLETKEKYRGTVKDIQKDIYTIEICTNKRKSEANEVERVTVKANRLEKAPLFV